MAENDYLEEDEWAGDNYLEDDLGYDPDDVLDKQDRKFFRIALWSDNLSKVFLGLGILQFIIQLLQLFFSRSHGADFGGLIFPIIEEVYSLILSALAFLVLQAVSEGIYALIDIKELAFDLNLLENDEVESSLESL